MSCLLLRSGATADALLWWLRRCAPCRGVSGVPGGTGPQGPAPSGGRHRRAGPAGGGLHGDLSVLEGEDIPHARFPAQAVGLGAPEGALGHATVAVHEMVSIEPGRIGEGLPGHLEALAHRLAADEAAAHEIGPGHGVELAFIDRKSTRLNSSHLVISYA